MSSSTSSVPGPGTRGSIVNVLSWFLIVTSFLAVTTRLVIKYIVTRKVNSDDWAITISLVSVLFPPFIRFLVF